MKGKSFKEEKLQKQQPKKRDQVIKNKNLLQNVGWDKIEPKLSQSKEDKNNSNNNGMASILNDYKLYWIAGITGSAILAIGGIIWIRSANN